MQNEPVGTGPDVLGYYEENTLRMLRWGPGRSEGVIHRAVRDPDCPGPREALRSVERRILNLLSDLAPDHVVDLGCGVGSSALWLAERLPLRMTGITLSPLQAALAGKAAARRGLGGRCRFLAGDFCSPLPIEAAGAAYAIESLSHAPDPGSFFARQAEILLPGSLLLVCDDFRTRDTAADPEEERWIRRFSEGWRLPSLRSAQEIIREARENGFALVSDEDLTPFLRPTPRAALAARKLFESLPVLKPAVRSSLAGGTALQVCLRRGWIRYRFLAFRREPS
jgi:tocopherol O-methyltransferase